MREIWEAIKSPQVKISKSVFLLDLLVALRITSAAANQPNCANTVIHGFFFKKHVKYPKIQDFSPSVIFFQKKTTTLMYNPPPLLHTHTPNVA